MNWRLSTDWRLVAAHEAGHAAAALALGVVPYFVALDDPEPDIAGRVLTADEDEGRLSLGHKAVIAAAGYAGEVTLVQARWMPDEEPSAHDRDHVAHGLGYPSYESNEGEWVCHGWRQAVRRATHLLAMPRIRAVHEAVTAVLLERGTLDEADLLDIWREAAA